MFFFTKLTMEWPVSPSSEAVGSSMIRMSGCPAMARAMATRCCSPPLSLTGGSSARAFQADDLQILARLRERVVPVLALEDEGNGDVFGGGQARKQVVILEDEPDLVQAEIGQLIAARDSRCRRLPPRPCPNPA